MRLTVGSSQKGMLKPSRLAMRPVAVATIERVAHQLAQEAALGVPGHGPYRGDVEERHADADQHRDQLQALGAGQAVGQGQGDEGVEAKGHLRAGRVFARVDAGSAARAGRAG